jgi:hypothetical protein
MAVPPFFSYSNKPKFSLGRDRLIVSNGKTAKCHFVAGSNPLPLPTFQSDRPNAL